MAKVSGGEKVSEYLKKLAKLDKGLALKVGFLENARYPDGTHVAEVAAYNEFGHKTRSGKFIGPWPFFRNMIAAKQKEWPAAFAKLLKSTDYDLVASYRLMGEGIKGQLQASIRAINAPPLSEETVRRKGFSKPMIDTGHMLNSVDYQVTKKGTPV